MTILNHKNREEYTYHVLLSLKNGLKEKFRVDFLALHPMDQIDIFVTLNQEKRGLLYSYLTPVEFAEIFKRLKFKDQKECLEELDHAYTMKMIAEMHADDIVDFLANLDPVVAESLLNRMQKEEANDIKTLLAHRPDTAGAIMTIEYLAVLKNNTVGEVMKRLQVESIDAETIYYLYVIDEQEHLLGVVSLRELIVSHQDKKIEHIMNKHLISVFHFTHQREVVSIIKKYDFLAVPVITEQGKLIGIVTVDDVIDTMELAAQQDIESIGAVRGAIDVDVSAWEASKKRLPWLVLLLFLGMLTAGVISGFEATLAEIAIIAMFIPLIADMGGNTGTQSLAVVVRGLALGKLKDNGFKKLLKRECIVGLIMGSACGLIVSGISLFFSQLDLIFGFVIGFSLFCTIVISTMTGTLVPLMVNRLKIDPAVASGPFITTFNDMIGLMIYFTVATTLLTYY